jgi:N-acetylglucosaminyl-diphospho-decaprenol L-rhamnosyltransferase
MPIPPAVLSIIIVAYQSREEIGPCLASLPHELAGEPVEVLVVDNSRNADGTADFVRQHFPAASCLVPAENLGFGRGNNSAFAASRGECVLFLNPDTICNRDALEHCLRRAQREPDLGLISPMLVLADGTMDLACRRSIPTMWDGFCRAVGLARKFPTSPFLAGYNLTHLPARGTYPVGAINGAFMLGRREMFTKIAEPPPSGVFDARFFMYGDDLDLCIRVSKAGYRIIYDGRVEIIHLKGMSVRKDYDRMSNAIFDANRDVYLKHFNPRGSRLVRWKYTLTFGLWKVLARIRARAQGSRRVQPA